MFELVAVFLPNIIGVSLIDNRKKLSYKSYILNYALITLLVNSILCLTCYLTKRELLDNFNDIFFVQYVLFSIVLNIIIGLFIRFMLDNTSVSLRRK